MALIALIENWLDYPGFEAWRFVNLFLFVGAAIYLHQRFGRPISEALRSRASKIKLELENARKRKQLAEAALREVESRLSHIDGKLAEIHAHAEAEALAEAERIRQATQVEVSKLRAQAEREVAKILKGAQLEVRGFAAAEGIKEAELLIRRDLDPSADAKVIIMSANEFGGSQP